MIGANNGTDWAKPSRVFYTLELIPELYKMGIASVKIEGRQRSPAYVEQVARTWRMALDSYQQNS